SALASTSGAPQFGQWYAHGCELPLGQSAGCLGADEPAVLWFGLAPAVTSGDGVSGLSVLRVSRGHLRAEQKAWQQQEMGAEHARKPRGCRAPRKSARHASPFRTRRACDPRSWLLAAVLTAGLGWLSPSLALAGDGGGRGLCATVAAEHSAPPYVA